MFIFNYLKKMILESVSPDCIIELVGGFRRGKQTGHDVDLLISHPELGREKEILSKTIEKMGIKHLKFYCNFC